MSGDGRIWFVRFRGKVTGPFEWSQLQTMGSRNKLTRMHQVSNDRRNWQNATDVPGLVSVRASATGARPVAVEAEPQPEAEFATPRAPTALNLSSTMTAGFPEATDSPPVWHYSRSGQTAGPVTIEDIERMCRAGQLSPKDSVWRDGMANWSPIAETPEFMFSVGAGGMAGTGSRKTILVWSAVAALVVAAAIGGFFAFRRGGQGDSGIVLPVFSGSGEIVTAEPEAMFPGDSARIKDAEDKISQAVGFVVAGWKARLRNGERRDYRRLWEVKVVENGSTLQKLQALSDDQKAKPQFLEGEKDTVYLYRSPAWIRGLSHNLGMSGTCFAVTTDGYLLTNKHVILAANQFQSANRLIDDLKKQEEFETLIPQIWVFLEGKEYEAQIVHISSQYDLAVLKIPRSAGSYFTLTAEEPQNRAKLYTLGFPGAAESPFSEEELELRKDKLSKAKLLKDWFESSAYIHSSAQGAVSRIYVHQTVGKVIQHTAPILPGNSGGPLVRPDGRVVGINTWTLEGAKGLNYSQSLDQKGLQDEIDQYAKGVTWRPERKR